LGERAAGASTNTPEGHATSTRTAGRILLWLLVLNQGIAFGAGLYEHRIVLPLWIDASSPDGAVRFDAAAARAANSGLRFWAYVTTGPLTLLTLANLVAAWRDRGTARRMWLAAGAVGLAERILTFTYFIPTMVALMEGDAGSSSAETFFQWMQWNHVRHALVLAAWLLALKALVNGAGLLPDAASTTRAR
jgi:hypothetical protein